MFTGIVEERGTVVRAGTRLQVRCRTVAGEANVGASVAVNGVCLTVAGRSVDDDGPVLAFDLSPETLSRSALGRLRPGDPVNLERPVTLATRLGGHLVQGHVDAVGEVAGLEETPPGRTMRIRLPEGLLRYVVEKGSIAVDGVSLTVAKIVDGSVAIALIPHTLEVTTLGSATVGEPVNVEVDVIAKYLEGLVASKERT